MNLDESDLNDIRSGGGVRVRKANGESLKPLPGPPIPVAPAPTYDAELRKIPEEIRALAKALLAVANREPAPITLPAQKINVDAPNVKVASPNVNVAAPNVNVEAPHVTVKPQININTPQSWNIEVTARDSDRRIKSMTIKAAE